MQMLSKEQLEKIANQGPVDIGGAQNPIVTEMAAELLSLREQQPVTFEWRQHYSSIGKSGPWVKLNDQRTYEKLKSKHAGDADYEFRELFTAAKPAED